MWAIPRGVNARCCSPPFHHRNARGSSTILSGGSSRPSENGLPMVLPALSLISSKKPRFRLRKSRHRSFWLPEKDDRTWPSSEFCETIMQRLKDHHFQYEYKHVRGEKAGYQIYYPDFIPGTDQVVKIFLSSSTSDYILTNIA